jgi:hypothetical protein
MLKIKSRQEIRGELKVRIADAVPEPEQSRRIGRLTLADHRADALRRRRRKD